MSQKPLQRPPLNASLTPLTCLEVLPNLSPSQVTREFQNLKLADNNFTIEYKRKILAKHFDLRITSEFTGSTFSNIWNLLNRNQTSLACLEGQIRDVNINVQSLRGQVKNANMINSAVTPTEEIKRNVVPSSAASTIGHLSSDDETFKMVPQMTRQDTDEGFPSVFHSADSSKQCDNTTPQKPKQCDNTTPQKPKQCDNTTPQKPKQCDNTTPQKPKQCDNTTPKKPKQCDNVKPVKTNRHFHVAPLKTNRQKHSEQNVMNWKTSQKKMLRESSGERRKITRQANLRQAAGDKRKILLRGAIPGTSPGGRENHHKQNSGRPSSRWGIFNIFRGSSEYSDQSYNEYQIGEASPDTSPMNYRPRSLTPPPDRRDYVPQPQPLSYIELNRLPVVKLQGHELHTKCACEKPWQKDEEALQLLCGHKLHTACGCKLMETGVCPICKTAEIMDDKLREIRIDLSGFNF